jgi:hypothetical protein
LLQELGPDFDPQRNPLRNSPTEIEVRSAHVVSGAWDLELAAAQPVTAAFHLLYYPRWTALLDGRTAALRPEAGTGYALLDLPAGDHRIALRYGRTTAETAGLWISGLSVLALLGAAGWTLLGWARRRRRALAPGSAEAGRQEGAKSRDVGGARSRDVGGREPLAAGGGAPPIWLLIGATALLVVKFAVIDGATNWFRCASTPDRVCGAEVMVDIPFSEGPRLLGYTVPAYRVKPGDRLRVTLYWQVDNPAEQTTASFVHLLGTAFNPRTNHPLWGQQGKEAPGGHPLSGWTPGKIYRDEYEFQVDPETPAGEYELEIGWVEPETGVRLMPALVDTTAAPGMRVSHLDSLLLPGIVVQ